MNERKHEQGRGWSERDQQRGSARQEGRSQRGGRDDSWSVDDVLGGGRTSEIDRGRRESAYGQQGYGQDFGQQGRGEHGFGQPSHGRGIGHYGEGRSEPAFAQRGYGERGLGRQAYDQEYVQPRREPDFGREGYGQQRYGQDYDRQSFGQRHGEDFGQRYGHRGFAEQGYGEHGFGAQGYGPRGFWEREGRGRGQLGQERFERFDNPSSLGPQGYGTFGEGQRMYGAGKPPKGYTRTDERMREDLAERLIMHGGDWSEVEIAVTNGIVTLSGTVTERQMRFAAEQVADSVGGVKEVDNQIRVKRETTQRDEWNATSNGPDARKNRSMSAPR